MTKLTLNKNMDIDVAPIDPNNLPLYIEKMQEFFRPFAISTEIVNHLKILPLSSVYGIGGKPLLCKTLQEMFDQFIDEIDYLPSMKEVISAELKMSPEKLAEMEALAYHNLLKGVNKRLPVPVIIYDGLSPENISELRANQGTQTTAHPCIYIDDEDLVSFSPANLVKHYGYPIRDAKIFFQNFRSYHPSKVQLVKKGALLKPRTTTRNIFMLNIGDEPMVMWSYSQDIKQRCQLESKNITDVYAAMDIALHELPINDLQVWKNAAKGWFERKHPDSKWVDLDIKNQQRHIVNCIRHNSVGYDRIWRSAKPELVREFHKRVFEQTLRQIMIQFPYLSEECKRQLNNREI